MIRITFIELKKYKIKFLEYPTKNFLFIFILYYFANGKVFLKFYEWIRIA